MDGLLEVYGITSLVRGLVGISRRGLPHVLKMPWDMFLISILKSIIESTLNLHRNMHIST